MALTKEGDIEVVGEADDGKDALKQIKSLSPDVVIVDYKLPHLDGPGLARQIRRHLPTISVILLSSYDDDEELFHAIQAGAAGYLVKAASGQDLALQIRKVYQEEYPINEYLLSRPAVALHILQQFQDMLLVEEEVTPLLSPLSARETEILEY
ncbi:MAG: response regulator transcription factor, partial [Dehalococcoidia bacterium]